MKVTHLLLKVLLVIMIASCINQNNESSKKKTTEQKPIQSTAKELIENPNKPVLYEKPDKFVNYFSSNGRRAWLHSEFDSFNDEQIIIQVSRYAAVLPTF